MICKICGFGSKLSLVSHITRRHKISITEYKEQFPNEIVQIVSEKQKNNIRKKLKQHYSDDNIRNDMSNIMKNGGSWRCKLYWINKGYTEDEAENEISKKQKEICSERGEVLPEENVLRKEYWIERYNLLEDEAIQKISNIQKERGKNSKRFLGKRHDDKQKEKISISMSKMIKRIGAAEWASHFGDFKKSFRSKGEIELYEYVKNNINDKAECNVFINGYNVDIKYDNKIIEYFGDYWHCNPNKYDANYYHQILKMTAQDVWDKDKLKIETLQKKGYDVKIVWEKDWNKE